MHSELYNDIMAQKFKLYIATTLLTGV